MQGAAKTWKWFAGLGAGTALVAAVSCRESVTPLSEVTTDQQPVAQLSFERNAAPFDIDHSFTPVANSSVCSVGGGLSQFVLAPGYVATLVGSEPDFLDQPDMQVVNETGRDAGRYLYRTHEMGTNAGLSVTDLETGLTHVIAQRSDWQRFDGLVWTPWGTLITGEEINPDPNNLPDPEVPAATAGLAYEVDPITGVAHPRPALGVKSHEGIRFDEQGNIYTISERNPGFIFKFVPDHRNSVEAGQLYALKIVEDQGDRTGWATWVALDRAQVQINADAAAEAAGGTGYNRPEDVETQTSTGDDERRGQFLYVAVTEEDRVLAIDLSAGDTDHRDQVFVSDYVRDGVNAPADFDFPDNLALDKDGNLFITEDPGGSAPGKTKGDDVWVTQFDRNNPRQGKPVQRFLSITDCQAEPTGIYFSKSGRSLFVDVQHRGADGRDGSFAIQRISQVNFQVSGNK